MECIQYTHVFLQHAAQNCPIWISCVQFKKLRISHSGLIFQRVDGDTQCYGKVFMSLGYPQLHPVP